MAVDSQSFFDCETTCMTSRTGIIKTDIKQNMAENLGHMDNSCLESRLLPSVSRFDTMQSNQSHTQLCCKNLSKHYSSDMFSVVVPGLAPQILPLLWGCYRNTKCLFPVSCYQQPTLFHFNHDRGPSLYQMVYCNLDDKGPLTLTE